MWNVLKKAALMNWIDLYPETLVSPSHRLMKTKSRLDASTPLTSCCTSSSHVSGNRLS